MSKTAAHADRKQQILKIIRQTQTTHSYTPSTRDIAQLIGIHQTVVAYHIRQMEADGLLTRHGDRHIQIH
jgi:Mn-dependent DtxR family transcriptional regulator